MPTMKNKILTWLIDTLKDFRKALITFFVASGIGALIVASLIKFGTRGYYLISNHLTEIGILLLFTLFYLLGRRTEKSKFLIQSNNKVSIVHHDLVQIGNLKWDITIYSDNNFTIEPIPYCAIHDMKLVEQWPLYFCPRNNECNIFISKRDLPVAVATVESHIESQLRKMNK